MREILKTLLQKNPKIHVVINVTALETLQETLNALEALEYSDPEISQIAVSRSVKRGKYHMMEGLNPVYVITADGKATQSTI
jgi:precorrin-6Y C5,15-methyltransferase (decarboxylating)